MRIPKGKKLCLFFFFPSALYRPGSHLRVEGRVSGGGGAIHYKRPTSSCSPVACAVSSARLGDRETESLPQGTENYSSAWLRKTENFSGKVKSKKKNNQKPTLGELESKLPDAAQPKAVALVASGGGLCLQRQACVLLGAEGMFPPYLFLTLHLGIYAHVQICPPAGHIGPILTLF